MYVIGEKINKRPPLNSEMLYLKKTQINSINTKIAFSVSAVLLAIVSATMANTTTQKQDFNGVSSFFAPLTFDRFNMNGTLTSIEMVFNLQIEGGTLIIDNDNDSNVSGTFEFGVHGTISSTEVTLPDSSLSNQVFYSQVFNLGSNVGDGIGDYNSSGPDGLQYSGSNKSGDVSGFVDNMFWNDYIGTGTYNITTSISLRLDCGDFDKLEYKITTPISTRGYVKVAYNYDPIPEPATIILLTVGAFAFLKRKNSKFIRHRRMTF
jgi:hypothetical protein